MEECTQRPRKRSRSGLTSEKIWAVILPCSQNWLPPSKSLQYYPTHMGGAYLKVPTKPPLLNPDPSHGSKGPPDLVNHPSWWILEEMDRARAHPHWWEEIRANKRLTIGSGPRRHIVWENFSEPEALHYAQWQVAAFRLSLSQQEALGWWDAPPWLHGLCPHDFLPHIDASGTRDFQTVRQEKTLALAHVLRACTERSGALTGFLSDAAWELQKCMAPLIHLNGDDIVEASLLETTGEECEMSPMLDVEATLLGKNMSHQRPQRLLHPSQIIQRSLGLQNPLSRLMLLLPLLLHSLCQNPAATLPRRQRNPSKGLRLTCASLLSGSGPMWRGMKGYLTDGGNFGSFSAPRTSPAMTSKSKD